MPLERLGGDAVRTGALGRKSEPHEAATAHQRIGHQLAGQAPRVVVEVAVGDEGDVERVVWPRRHLLGQTLGALAHHAEIAAEDQRGADAGLGRAQELLGVLATAKQHQPLPPRACAAIQAATCTWSSSWCAASDANRFCVSVPAAMPA